MKVFTIHDRDTGAQIKEYWMRRGVYTRLHDITPLADRAAVRGKRKVEVREYKLGEAGYKVRANYNENGFESAFNWGEA